MTNWFVVVALAALSLSAPGFASDYNYEKADRLLMKECERLLPPELYGSPWAKKNFLQLAEDSGFTFEVRDSYLKDKGPRAEAKYKTCYKLFESSDLEKMLTATIIAECSLVAKYPENHRRLSHCADSDFDVRAGIIIPKYNYESHYWYVEWSEVRIESINPALALLPWY